jgi:hypothetical protein
MQYCAQKQKNEFILKKLCQAEGGAKILGVFRVKNHDFTPKNHKYVTEYTSTR